MPEEFDGDLAGAGEFWHLRYARRDLGHLVAPTAPDPPR